ncbi:MAG: hypothetical protein WDA16_11675 [Candidatus Thermoplasmatota archaeon]
MNLHRITVSLVLAALIFFDGTAAACPYVYRADTGESPTGGDRTIYIFWNQDDVLEVDVWEETNGKLDQGVNAYGGTKKGDTGLQRHNVCYATFTNADVVRYNWDHESNGGEHGYPNGDNMDRNVVTYVPFDGTPDECTVLGGSFVPADAGILPGTSGPNEWEVVSWGA